MHIAFVTPEYPLRNSETGGLGTYIKKTAQEIKIRGHKVSVFLESTQNKVTHDKGVVVYEINCHPLYYALNSRSIIKQLVRVFFVLYSALKIRSKVLKIHRNHNIDLIQSPNYLAPGIFLAKNKAFPIVTRVSSYAPLYHAAFGIPRTFGDYLVDYLELRQATNATKRFAPSHFMQKVYARFENCNLSFVPTPVEMVAPSGFSDITLKKTLDRLPSKQYILYFGSLSRIKGVDLMADVINQVIPSYPELGFIFIGFDYGLPNNEPVSEYILRNCPKFKKNIVFLPYQQHQDLYPFICNALAVVAPSRVDNYPNTCLEAQSMGIPIVGTNDTGIDELITDGETGFIAENSSSVSIASKIISLLKMSKKDRLEMQNNIDKNISSILAEDRVKLLIEYYEKVVKEFKKQVR